jgi:hypothetical protein
MWIKDVLRGRFIKWIEEAPINGKADAEFTTKVDGYTMYVKVTK